MVWHPDQSGLPPGSRRFILSLRATGEGHISSITFRSGMIDAENHIRMDEPTRFVTAPELVPNTLYDKTLFFRKLVELGVDGPFTDQVLATLGDQFTLDDFSAPIRPACTRTGPGTASSSRSPRHMLTLAKANYEIGFSPEQNISERVIFPSSPTETNGIEDARFVQFHDDDGSVRYYATYTAFDGKVTLPQILETDDFLHFKVSTLERPRGPQQGLRPLSAQGQRPLRHALAAGQREHLPDVLGHAPLLVHQGADRQADVLAGSSSSSATAARRIETEAGWLVLTHGVGPMRKYAMGAFLLDLDDPSRVIGRLDDAAAGAQRQRTRGLRPQRRLQLRRSHP